MNFLYKQQGHELIGAAMEVYNEMGAGFLEEVYQECLETELTSRQLPFVSQTPLELYFKGKKMKKRYKPDLFAFDLIVVELKAVKNLTGVDEAQLVNYLKGSRKLVGYLFNFGYPGKLQWKRMIYSS